MWLTCPLFGLQFDHPLGWTHSLIDFIMYSSTFGHIILTIMWWTRPLVYTCGRILTLMGWIRPLMNLIMHSCGLNYTHPHDLINSSACRLFIQSVLLGWFCPLVDLIISEHPYEMNSSTCGFNNESSSVEKIYRACIWITPLIFGKHLHK